MFFYDTLRKIEEFYCQTKKLMCTFIPTWDKNTMVLENSTHGLLGNYDFLPLSLHWTQLLSPNPVLIAFGTLSLDHSKMLNSILVSPRNLWAQESSRHQVAPEQGGSLCPWKAHKIIFWFKSTISHACTYTYSCFLLLLVSLSHTNTHLHTLTQFNCSVWILVFWMCLFLSMSNCSH